MSENIIALSAYAANNAGMISVNLALAQLVPGKVMFANLEVTEKTFGGLVSYSDKVTKEALEDATVVGWGDFIHSLTWARRDVVAHLAGRKKLDSEAALRNWYGLLMLEGVTPKKALSFGSTLYINSIAAYHDAAYAAALKNLSRKCSLLSFRDAVSPIQIKNLLDIDATSGCDCAMFLDSGKLPGIDKIDLPQGQSPGKYIVMASGRASFANEQNTFVHTLSYATGLPVVKLDWLNMKTDGDFVRAVKILKNARLCITDIYHMSVNAIREKVPVFCFYRSGFAGHSLDDEKKRLLFYGYGLREYLIDLDQLAFSKSPAFRDVVVKDVVAKLGQDTIYEMLNVNIPARINRLKQQVLEAIGG